jgi:hypothetical protein
MRRIAMTLLRRRSRLLPLTASGLLLSVASPLIAADPCPCGQAVPTATHVYPPDHNHDPCATITPGAIPAPPGSAVQAWEGRMAQKGAADRFVVYLHEWYMGGQALGPYGSSHLMRMGPALLSQPVVVVVEAEPSPEVNENRRLQIVHLLQSIGIADAEHRVVVALPTAEGMAALEAAQIYTRGHALNGGAGQAGGATGYGNPLTPTQGGLTPAFGGFMGGFRGGLGGGYSGF